MMHVKMKYIYIYIHIYIYIIYYIYLYLSIYLSLYLYMVFPTEGLKYYGLFEVAIEGCTEWDLNP